MNILFENNTMLYCDGATADLLSVSGSAKAIEHSRKINMSRTFFDDRSFQFPEDYHEALSDFNNLRRASLMNTDPKKIDEMREYKRFRTTLFVATFIICTIISSFAMLFLDVFYDYTIRFILFAASIGLSVLISSIFTRAKFGDRQDGFNNPMKYNYRFTEDYILMSSDDDSQIMRYERIRVAENEKNYFIQYEGKKYEMSKDGFNCPIQQFIQLMENKGIRIETYIGQF